MAESNKIEEEIQKLLYQQVSADLDEDQLDLLEKKIEKIRKLSQG